MPLTPGAPVSSTIKELVHHGSRPRPMKQIVAIAEANHRRKRADGGPALTNEPIHLGGLVAGHDGGRDDTIECSVPRGSYIIPADIVSGLGQGNTTKGATVLDGVFRTRALIANPALSKMPMVPVKLSSGEYSVCPPAVARVGDGNLSKGHDGLDKWVVLTRAKIVKSQKKLPGPKGANQP